MKLIITGGNGQLGMSLRELLESREDIDATFIDIEDLDLTNRNDVCQYFKKYQCDILVNCAAYTAVDKAESEIDKAESVNIKAVRNIAEAAVDNSFKIIHISTDYVFDGEKESAYEETDIPNPKTIYGKTKLEGEKILLSILPEAIIIRTAWLYSLYGKNFFLTMKGKAMRRETARVVDDQIGSPTNAEDLACTIIQIIYSKDWKPGIFHFSNLGETTWFDFTREIYKLYGADENLISPIKTSELNSPAQRPKYSILDKTKIKKTYKIEIPFWEESIKKIVTKDLTQI